MQALRFLLVGVLNSALGLAVIYLLMAAGVEYKLANAGGYAVGFLISFVVNRAWTFAYRGGWTASFIRWVSVAGIAYLGNLVAVVALHRGFGIDAGVAQLGGIPVYTVLSYLGGRFYAFAPERVR